MRIILLGAPGAGKGTQAEILGKELYIPTVSTGNIIRSATSDGTPLGAEAETYVKAGQLVPDTIVINMLKEYLIQNNCTDGYILDGFPRNLQQAQTLLDMGIQINLVINLRVDDTTIKQRLGGRRVCRNCGCSYHVTNKQPMRINECDSCGGELIVRNDDNPETVNERLRVYYEATEPLVKFYTDKGILHAIDGNCSMQQITEEILDKCKQKVEIH